MNSYFAYIEDFIFTFTRLVLIGNYSLNFILELVPFFFLELFMFFFIFLCLYYHVILYSPQIQINDTFYINCSSIIKSTHFI